MQDIQVIANTDDGRLVCILSEAAYSVIESQVGLVTAGKIELIDIHKWAEGFERLMVMLDMEAGISNVIMRLSRVNDYDYVHNANGELVRDDSGNVVKKEHPPVICNSRLHKEYLAGYSPFRTLVRIAKRKAIVDSIGPTISAKLKSRMAEKGLLEMVV